MGVGKFGISLPLFGRMVSGHFFGSFKGRRDTYYPSSFNQTLTVTGTIVSHDPIENPSFSIEARTGDIFQVFVGP